MIHQPHRAHSLLSVASATGIALAVVRAFAKATPASGWRFAQNLNRPAHLEFMTPTAVAALVDKYGAPADWRDRLAGAERPDRVIGEFGPLCEADDAEARANFNTRLTKDRFDQPPEQVRPDFRPGAWVPSHRAALGLI